MIKCFICILACLFSLLSSNIFIILFSADPIKEIICKFFENFICKPYNKPTNACNVKIRSLWPFFSLWIFAKNIFSYLLIAWELIRCWDKDHKEHQHESKLRIVLNAIGQTCSIISNWLHERRSWIIFWHWLICFSWTWT